MTTGNTNGWTPERRARQAEAIHTWAPWQKSTGPRTPAGKSRVGKNWITANRRRLWTLKALIDAVWLQLDQHDREVEEFRQAVARFRAEREGNLAG